MQVIFVVIIITGVIVTISETYYNGPLFDANSNITQSHA